MVIKFGLTESGRFVVEVQHGAIFHKVGIVSARETLRNIQQLAQAKLLELTPRNNAQQNLNF